VVASTEGTGTANCEGRGGSKFVTGAATTYACNGKEGSGGGGGGGWSKTLPSGETETGAWTFTYSGQSTSTNPISFPIPLTPADAAAITVRITDSNGDATCTGTVTNPTAPAGSICFYIAEGALTENAVYSTDYAHPQEVGSAGAFLYTEGTFSPAVGSFAVTAPTS
jgi:hypothetical protein